MKLKKRIFTTLCVAVFSSSLIAKEYNLQKLASAENLSLHNREIEVAPEKFPGAVYLTKSSNDGLAWIKDISLSNGVIELEAKGANRPGQSFVGIAFHGQDDSTFDAIYLRPFNFRNPNKKNHSLQYISMPQWDWRSLRSKHPGKYESSIAPAPSPEDWVHLKLLIQDKKLTVSINHSDTPELEVDLLNESRSGSIGLWVGNGSDGEFRNLKVTETP